MRCSFCRDEPDEKSHAMTLERQLVRYLQSGAMASESDLSEQGDSCRLL